MPKKQPDSTMTVAEAGRRGGTKTRDTYGSEFYSEQGKIGGTTVKARHGTEFYKEIGKRGGTACLANHGREHFAAMGRKGRPKPKVIEPTSEGKDAIG